MVRFFCDLPQIPGAMGKMLLTVMVAVAELEAGLVGERTKAALAATKARGVKLGGRTRGSIVAQDAAKARAKELRPSRRIEAAN
jgi:DNA invertase Pin-like site-specific DNA recombinase